LIQDTFAPMDEDNEDDSHCYRSVCRRGQVALKGKSQTGVTGASPPTVTSMGGSFYSGWLIPRETSLVIWGIERKRIKRLRLKRSK
jgi:hypothetical protein